MNGRNDYNMQDQRNPYGSRGGYVDSRSDYRNPYGSRGGYVVSSRRGRRDRAMGNERRGDMNYDMGYSDYASRGNSRSRLDRGMGYGDMGGYDMNNMPHSYDGHYPQGQGSTYYPIEAMGVFNGYYGMPEQDYARGGRRDYGYDMRYGMRGGYHNMDYGYDFAGDFGERLTKSELEHWDKKLLKKIPERDKSFFTKENIVSRAKAMGVQMNDFNEEELFTTVLMMYTDHCDSVGQNYDMYIKIGRDFLMDDDTSVGGGEKLAVYYDCIVEGEDD